jgi:alkyl hydroperoxide reductase subunit AhpC
MSRLHEPNATRIAAELAWAVEELARETPRDIPLPTEGRELIGTAAPAWTLEAWLRGEPRTIEDQKGKVTLIRYFTNTCPYCATSMPAIQSLQTKYAELNVLGFYHPKPIRAKRSRASVEAMLDEWKVTFPIALDTEWKTLERYWFQSGPRTATSASFLIDKKGVIRWIHPGPEIQPDDPELDAVVKKLLDEQ